MAKLELDPDELRPLITTIVTEVLNSTHQIGLPDDRIAYTEPEAAAMLGVRPHVLRDARLRGEIEASTCGKRIVYTLEALRAFLVRNRWQH